tara:strand:- start:1737 stop:2417 length:681 start_codon:yes stop_codon:yes gene_type:complete
MTNFQAIKKKNNKWITRKNIILSFPISISIVLTIFLFFYLLLPKIKNTIKFSDQIKEMQIKKDELPLKEEILKQVSQNLEKEKNNQEKLLNLIAGTEELYTYMSRLNLIAIKSKVSIVEVKPDKVEKYVPSTLTNNNSSARNTNKLSLDPLIAEGLEKRNIDIKIEGSYPDIINFLKLVESLPMIVVTSDFKIDKFMNKNSNEKKFNNKYFLNNVEMRLSIYGRDL